MKIIEMHPDEALLLARSLTKLAKRVKAKELTMPDAYVYQVVHAPDAVAIRISMAPLEA